MTMLSRSATVTLIGFAVVLSACGGGSSAECRKVATAQAESERTWATAIEAHNAAHAEAADHLELEEQLLVSRVEVIIATESTRRACR